MRIPVNVTADSGNVTGIPANVTEGRCCAFGFYAGLLFRLFSPIWNWIVFELMGPCQAAGGPPLIVVD